MDLNEIKELMEADGGKFIIVENGKPIMVVASFEDYKNRLKLNRDKNPGQSKRPLPKELQDEQLKIEDLPFR